MADLMVRGAILHNNHFMRALSLILILIAGSLSAQPVIQSVSPSSANPGTKDLVITFSLPERTPPTPPARVQPISVTIGSITAKSIAHTSLGTVTATFDIPEDAAEGTQKVVITFPTRRGEVEFRNSSLFSIGEPSRRVFTNGPPAEGINLVSTLNSKETHLIDNDHNILKTWTSEHIPRNSAYLLEDGSLMRPVYTASPVFYGGGAGGRMEQHDWEGNLIWSFDYDTADYRQHHDIEVLPNGNILLIAWQMKTREEAIAAGRDPDLLKDDALWPDSIIEVTPTRPEGGTIVWEWHVWDHLIQDFDASKANYGNVADHPEKIDLNYTRSGPDAGIADWNHINSVDYNAELDQILLSVLTFNEIWIIDHSTTTAEAAGPAGDLLYRWGNPAAYKSGNMADQKLFIQHDAQWINEGLPGEDNILIFNNGEGRPDGDYSSVEEIIPPLAPDGSYTLGLPPAPVWSYTNSDKKKFFAPHISGAQRLPNGNTLICEGTKRYVFEVTPDGKLVWEYDGLDQIFRFERYPPNYPGLQSINSAQSSH